LYSNKTPSSVVSAGGAGGSSADWSPEGTFGTGSFFSEQLFSIAKDIEIKNMSRMENFIGILDQILVSEKKQMPSGPFYVK
jgi:hypothetical protein